MIEVIIEYDIQAQGIEKSFYITVAENGGRTIAHEFKESCCLGVNVGEKRAEIRVRPKGGGGILHESQP